MLLFKAKYFIVPGSILHILFHITHWLISTDYPVCGVPTIRSDTPAPRIRRISDRTNYGDEANAYALLFPSIFSQKGVYEGDFFKSRPKAEVQYIFSRTFFLDKCNALTHGELESCIDCEIHYFDITIL